MQYLKDELWALWGLIVVTATLLAGGIISDFFTGIGDRMFGKKKEKP